MVNSKFEIKTQFFNSRYMQVGKQVAVTGFAQIVIQALGFISGIMVIRFLPTQEYALYTLANTMLGTMTVLADGGISTGIMAQGGKVWDDREKLGVVLATGIFMRKKFAIYSLVIAVPILLYLLRHNNASWLMSILIAMSLIPAFFMTLSGTILEIAPKLHQNISSLQKTQVGLSVGRLVLLCLSIFIFPWAFVAILAAGLPQIWSNLQLKSISFKVADFKQSVDILIEKNVLQNVKRILPGAIYYCISGQITIWLFSIFGKNISSIAQIGALGRFSIILSVLSTLFATLVIPRFAKLVDNKRILIFNYIKISVIIFFLNIIVITVVYLFSTKIIMLLGAVYSNLEIELTLSIISASISMIAGAYFSLSTCRGWVIHPILNIGVNIFSIALGIFFLDFSTIKSALYFNIFLGSVQLMMNSVFCFYKVYTTIK